MATERGILSTVPDPRAFNRLSRLREMAPPGSPQHQLLANLEHRMFVRDLVGQNPLLALGFAGAIPAYDIAKRLGLRRGRSLPGLDQVGAGYMGILEGLGDVPSRLPGVLMGRE